MIRGEPSKTSEIDAFGGGVWPTRDYYETAPIVDRASAYAGSNVERRQRESGRCLLNNARHAAV